MIYAEPECARRRSFREVLAYVLNDTAARIAFAVTANLMLGLGMAAEEMEQSVATALALGRCGRKPDNAAFHFIISWHPHDRPTPEHMLATAQDALAALGLAEHQAVMVGHTDTEKPHVHIAVNVIHPETGRAAKLGWRHRTMSRWAAGYEKAQGVIRCNKRFIPKAANESRKRLGKAEWERRQRETDKRKASITPAPRP